MEYGSSRRAVACLLSFFGALMSRKRYEQQREDVRFRILRVIAARPEASQREIAEELGVSVGAVNYCLRALIQKGHVKLANLRAAKNKLGYVYVLTPEGVAHRTALAARFIERKLSEYEAIRRELKLLNTELDHGSRTDQP